MGVPLAPDPAWAQSLGETRLRLVKARRTSLSIIHLFMFISGVEYAVVFPSLWEYLQSLGVPSSSTQWLGITLSAMTLTDIFSSLVVGRILDTKPGIKFMVIALNLPQIAGACLYLFANSPLLLLASRLVSGLGKAISVVFLTDVCRSTEKNDRTPVLLLFNIAFQVGLLLGPAANLALSLIDLATPFGRLTKLNSPGLLLWLLWLLFSFLVCALYTDLTAVSRDEKVAEELARAYVSQESRPVSGRGSEAGDVEHHGSDHAQRDVSDMVQNRLVDFSRDCNSRKAQDQDLFDEESQPLLNSEESSEEDGEDLEDKVSILVKKDEDGRQADPPPLVFTVTEETYPTQLSARRSISPIALNSPTSSLLVSQVTQIGSASPATLYGSITLSSMRRARRDSTTSRKSDIVINAAELMMGVESGDEEEEDGDEERSESERSRGEGERALLLPRPRREEQEVAAPSLSEVLDVLLREELVALAFLRFVALFCQTGLEAVVPPVMQLFFDFGDLANSLLYLGCGLQLILVFLLLSAASKAGASDRNLISCGLLTMVGALVWLMCTLPSFSHHTPANLPFFVVGVAIDLAGIPTVCDVALALYSKLLPDRVQGAGQAFRRLVSQLALLLGPLWAPATLNNPMLMLAVPLGLLLLGAILFLASWRWMRVGVEVEEMETAL